MSIRKLAALALLTASFTAGGAVSQAHAAPQWIVLGKALKAGENLTKVPYVFTATKLRWAIGANKFEVVCNKFQGEIELKGGNPGKDQVETATFEECKLEKGPAGCVLKANPIAEGLPGWPTELIVDAGGKILDKFTNVKFSLELEKCANNAFNRQYKIKGSLAAQVFAHLLLGLIFRLPEFTPEAKLETEEAEPVEVVLSAEGELTYTGLEVGEGMHWYAEGVKLTEETALSTTSVSGKQVVTGVVSGLTLKITCEHVDQSGKVLNPPGGKMGLGLSTLLYLECVVTPSASKCTVPGGMFTVNASLLLVGTNALPEVEFTPDNSTHFVEVPLEHCTSGELNKAYPVDGSILGMINNTTSEIAINEVKGSASMLKFAGSEASLAGSTLVEMEGGGKLEAKE